MRTQKPSPEVDKFEDLAEQWWQLDGSFKALHAINPLRLQFILQQITVRDRSVIDLGCGGGILCEALALEGAYVTGVDEGEKTIQAARSHAQSQSLTIAYQRANIEEYAAEHSASYDLVTCMELLEHVDNPATILTACAKLVKPGGLIFFSTLNRTPKAYLQAIIGAEYLLRLLPRGTHQYRLFIRPAELTAAGREANLSLRALTGMTYHLIRKTYTLCKSTDVNYLMCFEKNGNS